MQLTTPDRTIALAASTAAQSYGERPAVRYKRDGRWEQRTFAQVGDIVERLARGLVACGMQPGDRICILASTRVEWTYASLAITSAGCVVVPMYPTNSPEECSWVARNSGARAVFCEKADQLAKLVNQGDAPSWLETMIVFDPAGDTGDALTLSQLSEYGREIDGEELTSRQHAVEAEDIYTIIYTSGATGPPKGVVLSHRNCSSVGPIVQELGFVSGEDISYLYLPLAHVFALTIQLASFTLGATIVYFGGDVQRIVSELDETRPTFFPSVPRVFEKLYSIAMRSLEKLSKEQRERFEHAIEVGSRVREMERRGDPVAADVQRVFDEGDANVYRYIRTLFGGRVRDAVTGAAPIAPEILKFFFACGVPVLEGWGMTETTGFGCMGTRKTFKFGTVGKPVPGLELRLAGDGEILVRGRNVFREYWRDPEATKEAFTDDGWLRTGDIGQMDADGFLSIVGRNKDIIITSGGKNLAPANLENELRQSRWISSAVMYGDRRPYPVALITLDWEEMVLWASDRDLPQDIASLAGRPEVRDLIKTEIDRANSKYARPEQIKRFAIVPRDFTHEAGELTSTLKLKREVIYQRYAQTLESLYDT